MRVWRDTATALLLILGGLGYAGFAAASYEAGTLRKMGPGFYPTALGILLSLLGLALLMTARPWRLRGRLPQLSLAGLGPGVVILVSVAAFALVLPRFGLLVAVAAVTAISALAPGRARITELALLIFVLCLASWLIFRLGLGLTVPLLRSPW